MDYVLLVIQRKLAISMQIHSRQRRKILLEDPFFLPPHGETGRLQIDVFFVVPLRTFWAEFSFLSCEPLGTKFLERAQASKRESSDQQQLNSAHNA